MVLEYRLAFDLPHLHFARNVQSHHLPFAQICQTHSICNSTLWIFIISMPKILSNFLLLNEHNICVPGTVNNRFLMDVWWFPTIFDAYDLVHHPVETTIQNWLFGVAGIYIYLSDDLGTQGACDRGGWYLRSFRFDVSSTRTTGVTRNAKKPKETGIFPKVLSSWRINTWT